MKETNGVSQWKGGNNKVVDEDMCRKQRKEQEVKEKRVKTKWSRNIAES